MITIIIPVYNRAILISETLNAVMSQTHEQWKCIVVDDGSTDDTVCVVNAFAKADSRISCIVRPNSHLKGGCGARNYGALSAQTPYIMFLDSDDLITQTCVEERLKLLDAHRDHELFIFHSGVFYNHLGDSNLLWNKVGLDESIQELFKRFLHQDTPWCTNGVVWKKDFFIKVGMWSEDLRAWQDWELHTKSLLHNPRIVISNNHPDNYYRRDSSVTAISDAANLRTYLISVMIAIGNIQKELNPSQFTKEVARDIKDLFKKTIIEYPIKKGKRKVPLILCNDINYPSFVLSKFSFYKNYLIVFATRNYYITKILKKMGFQNWLNRYRRTSNFLKLTINE